MVLHRVLPFPGLPQLEIQTGLDDQRIGIGRKPVWIHLRVESVRVWAAAIAIHEVTFHFHVPEFVEVNPPRNDFIVIVIGR